MSPLVRDQSGWAMRLAEEGDLPGILAIVNDIIATSTAIYHDQPETPEQRRVWLEKRRDWGYPVLVADCLRGGGIIGFATFSDFRNGWDGFRHTVEHSVHVRADARGRGVGQTLVGTLIGQAQALGKHVMMASIDADNEASLRLHEKLGFVRVGLLPQVGCKFGRWLDMALLQRRLDETPPR